MQPIEHATTNARLGKPSTWDEEKDGKCQVLPVSREVGDTVSYSSFWKPSPEELKALNEGRPVKLQVFSPGHPPVWVGVEGVPQE